MASTVALMWDCYGLEAVAKVPDSADHTFAVLANRPKPGAPNINMWKLRAQFNPQRNYEIYIISVDDNITVDDIRDSFDGNAQGMADTVRNIGHCFYSNRDNLKKKVIV